MRDAIVPNLIFFNVNLLASISTHNVMFRAALYVRA